MCGRQHPQTGFPDPSSFAGVTGNMQKKAQHRELHYLHRRLVNAHTCSPIRALDAPSTAPKCTDPDKSINEGPNNVVVCFLCVLSHHCISQRVVRSSLEKQLDPRGPIASRRGPY